MASVLVESYLLELHAPASDLPLSSRLEAEIAAELDALAERVAALLPGCRIELAAQPFAR